MKTYQKSPNKVLRAQFQNLSKTERFKKWKRAQLVAQNFRCGWCLGDIRNTPYEVEHIIPLASSRKINQTLNYYSNLLISCKSCNQQKGIKRGYKYPKWIKENKELLRSLYNNSEINKLYYKMKVNRGIKWRKTQKTIKK